MSLVTFVVWFGPAVYMLGTLQADGHGHSAILENNGEAISTW